MLCNFHVTQSIELNGAFGILDIHNVYQLKAFAVGDARRELRMGFEGNEHRLAGRPAGFELVFRNVETLTIEGLPEDPSDVIFEEVGFVAPGEHDYRWLLQDGEPGAEKHLVFLGLCEPSESNPEERRVVVRISAELAELIG